MLVKKGKGHNSEDNRLSECWPGAVVQKTDKTSFKSILAKWEKSISCGLWMYLGEKVSSTPYTATGTNWV